MNNLGVMSSKYKTINSYLEKSEKNVEDTPKMSTFE